MECNKEEALRAKEIAEKKLENKDFRTARKFALKAQQLYPDLENITQMLVVCDVHCSAELKLFGTEMDWYKILQIELTANDATIKKQYRKLALQLHPDKNKFAGAEAAFKLIGEAQRVLLDKEKRSRLDMNLHRVPMNRTAMSSHHQQNVQMNFNPVMQTNVRPNFTNLNPQQQQQSRQASQQGLNGGGHSTFWTICSFCSAKYEYRRDVLNRFLRCQHCNRPFIAYDVNVQGTTPAVNSSQQAFGAQKYSQNFGAFKVGVGSQGNLHTHRSNKESHSKRGRTADVSVKPNGKRKRKQVAESSESSESISSPDSEEDMLSDQNGFPGVSSYREEQPRRSMRQKHQVSYKENMSDDDDEGTGSLGGVGENCGEAAKMNEQNGFATDLKGDQKKGKQKQNFYSEEKLQNINEETTEVRGKEAEGGSKIDEASEHSTLKSTNHPDNLVYPDPEFSDFDKDKKEESFIAGQIWAIYDTIDGMPRFYALIRKVLSPGFKLRITWFEPDPDDDDEAKWFSKCLPIACGKHKLGGTEITENRLMFSHLISCEKIGRNTYKVYPKKGETWALFKNWDIKWHVDMESHRQYDFEFVEILSDYVEGVGVVVAYLAKLKGFVSLFSRIEGGNHTFQILPVELFRFSHRVPSFEMTGQERVGVPVGSYELDPASLPMNLEEIAVPEDLEVKVGHCLSVRMSTRLSHDSELIINLEGDASTAKVNLQRSNSAEEKNNLVDHVDNGSAHSASATEAFEIPDPLFCNFDAGRSIENFQIDQIWAFYSDEDGLPKYYGQIEGVQTSPDVQLQVTYLTNCWLPENAVKWEDKDMVISCGKFRIETSAAQCTYANTYSVSHQVQASTEGTKKEYEIFPRKGEIWALYRNWTSKIKRSDLENWEYDIVEVVGKNDLWMDVLPLELVSGYNSVFKGKSNGRSAMHMRISRKELLRFSHQIPAFKLTQENGGNLRGFWELDPGALPLHYFHNK